MCVWCYRIDYDNGGGLVLVVGCLVTCLLSMEYMGREGGGYLLVVYWLIDRQDPILTPS